MAPPGIGTEVEGRHAVAAAIAAGRVQRLFVERSRAGSLDDLLDPAREAGAEIRIVDEVASLAATSAPQGVVARCRPLPPASVADVAAAVTPAAVVVLDHLEDARNVGAVARSALAAGMGGLVLARHRAAPLSAAAFKAAAGALEHLRVAAVSSVAAAVDELRRLEVWTVGLDSGSEQSLFGCGLFTEAVAIVVGAEGEGLGRLVSERVDTIVSIPLAGPVESLNAAVAASLAAYEVARARSDYGE
jgi:23S rRNA (guanosine2251-2'-O)-methyltransferase